MLYLALGALALWLILRAAARAPRLKRREWRFNPLWTKLVSVDDEEFGLQRLTLVSRRQEVAVARDAGPEERARITPYRAAGFSGYLIKPLRRASLAERVLAATAAAPAIGQHVEDERVAQATAPGAKILLVEDNPINAMLARTLLMREGCAVDHARGGEEAIAALKVGRYDLILMDMRMPGLSGVETTAKLRAGGVGTPIVALTANAFEDDRHACLAAGMNDFLVKPLAPDALRAALSRWAKGGWTEPATRVKVG